VFDGKNAGWTSANNVVRDCIISGASDSGVEFLASSSNLIENCTITNVGRHGIEAGKSSATAPQPNKKSNDNIIRNNVIDSAGVDSNRIEGNQVTNSSNNVASADGIRILSSDSVACDDNVVDGNVATDTQTTKTQRYGLNIGSALCNRTVVEGTNDFSGNRVGAISDLGTATQYGVDSVPPTAPSGLSATGAYKTRVDLFWTASVDGVGVTAYEVWRDGSALATIGDQTT
jgi:parallel beta-helix repeat protein